MPTSHDQSINRFQLWGGDRGGLCNTKINNFFLFLKKGEEDKSTGNPKIYEIPELNWIESRRGRGSGHVAVGEKKREEDSGQQ